MAAHALYNDAMTAHNGARWWRWMTLADAETEIRYGHFET